MKILAHDLGEAEAEDILEHQPVSHSCTGQRQTPDGALHTPLSAAGSREERGITGGLDLKQGCGPT